MKPNHLSSFNCMLPWIGKHYSKEGHLRLLVLGESHYFPSGSHKHLNSEDWYSRLSMKDLNEDEISYISTADIVNEAIDTNFKIKPFGIFREINKILSDQMSGSKSEKGIYHCMFMNFFQRPAQEEGDSIQEDDNDIQIAKETLEWVLSEYKPVLVAVVSKKAGGYVSTVLDKCSMPYCITPHPTCAWWNRSAKSYGNKYGREILPAFLKSQKWAK